MEMHRGGLYNHKEPQDGSSKKTTTCTGTAYGEEKILKLLVDVEVKERRHKFSEVKLTNDL